jgi:hypothetical protein
VQLDRIRIQIRPRSRLEALDLAVAVCRRHWLGLGVATAVGVAPFLVFNLWAFDDESVRRNPDEAALLYALVLLMQAPWATAGITLYLGQATFADRIQPRRIARDFARSLGQMILFQGLLRGAIVSTCLGALFVPLLMKHLNEIILLERSPLGRVYRRMTAFHGRIKARILGETAFDLALGLLATLILVWGLRALVEIWNDDWSTGLIEFQWADALLYWFPVFSRPGQVAVWLTIAFFAVARFVSYLDCRIRREGWDVELKLRSAAQAARATEAA